MTNYQLNSKTHTLWLYIIHQWQTTPFLTPAGLWFPMYVYYQQRKHNLFRGPSNEHSYKDWFQLT
jgi:hypothetical protein